MDSASVAGRMTGSTQAELRGRLVIAGLDELDEVTASLRSV